MILSLKYLYLIYTLNKKCINCERTFLYIFIHFALLLFSPQNISYLLNILLEYIHNCFKVFFITLIYSALTRTTAIFWFHNEFFPETIDFSKILDLQTCLLLRFLKNSEHWNLAFFGFFKLTKNVMLIFTIRTCAAQRRKWLLRKVKKLKFRFSIERTIPL